jgi:hypothetical protein
VAGCSCNPVVYCACNKVRTPVEITTPTPTPTPTAPPRSTFSGGCSCVGHTSCSCEGNSSGGVVTYGCQCAPVH